MASASGERQRLLRQTKRFEIGFVMALEAGITSLSHIYYRNQCEKCDKQAGLTHGVSGVGQCR